MFSASAGVMSSQDHIPALSSISPGDGAHFSLIIHIETVPTAGCAPPLPSGTTIGHSVPLDAEVDQQTESHAAGLDARAIALSGTISRTLRTETPMGWTCLDNAEISAKDKIPQTLTGLIDDEESARRRSRTRAVMAARADRGWKAQPRRASDRPGRG